MKISTTFILILLTFAAQAQLKVGINAGLPVGKTSDYYNLSGGFDVYLILAESNDEVFEFGLGSGFLNYFGDEVDDMDIDNAQFIPVTAAGRFTFAEFFVFGADVGYGIAISGDADGGVYGRVVFGLKLSDNLEIDAFYHLVKVVKGQDFASTGLGLLYSF